MRVAAMAVAMACGAFVMTSGVQSATPTVAEPTSASQDRWPAVRSMSMRSTNLDRSIHFYTQGLGMILRGRVERGPLTEVMFAFAGKESQTGLMVTQLKGEGAGLPVEHGNAGTTVILGVPDAIEVETRLKAAGYQPSEVRAMGPYRIFDVRDPDGHHYEIVQSP